MVKIIVLTWPSEIPYDLNTYELHLRPINHTVLPRNHTVKQYNPTQPLVTMA